MTFHVALRWNLDGTLRKILAESCFFFKNMSDLWGPSLLEIHLSFFENWGHPSHDSSIPSGNL